MATEVESKHEQSLLEIARQLRDELEGYIVQYKSDDPQINDGGLYFLAAFLKKFQFGCFEKAVSGLAEQAEREARKSTVGHLAERQKMTSAELQADWPWRSITADAWKEFAAWLRATAGEKG